MRRWFRTLPDCTLSLESTERIHRFYLYEEFECRLSLQADDERSGGAYSGEVTPVPIPNTVVKLFAPMVLATTERVGCARFFDLNRLP